MSIKDLAKIKCGLVELIINNLNKNANDYEFRRD